MSLGVCGKGRKFRIVVVGNGMWSQEMNKGEQSISKDSPRFMKHRSAVGLTNMVFQGSLALLCRPEVAVRKGDVVESGQGLLRG